jgi:hypothetical protein
MSSKKKGGGQEGAQLKMIERQRMQQAAADAAKKLQDAIKDAEETARVAVVTDSTRRSTGQPERSA